MCVRAQRKAAQVSAEAADLGVALERCSARRRSRADDERARAELFHRTTSAASARAHSKSFSNILKPLLTRATPPQAASAAADFDAEAQAFASAQRSTAALHDLLHSGSGLLSALSAQKQSLKNARKGALNALNALGVSNSLLNAAHRRQSADAALAGACALFTLTLFAALLWLTRGRK